MEANKSDRPVHLNLLKIRLPVSGWLSILHRVTGTLLFLATPFMVYLLQLSLSSRQGFNQSLQTLHSPLVVMVLLFLFWSICHHLLAGIRFLLLDIDVGIDSPVSSYSAWAVLISAPLLALLVVMVIL